ncbi:trypsin [Ceratitis capitata]|uniref:trypsin n=1 Tax=Ceratitis capitata TaxID=7213 RepID=UPI000329782B|nr:trypsin [Ceratitis capitata]
MAKLFVCSFLFVIAACVGNIYAEDIQGGVATTIAAHPYIVSVQNSDGSRICGGALINSTTVVTTASCLDTYEVSELLVGLNNGAKTVKIAAYGFDPSYDFSTMESDVAVVKLAESVDIDAIELASSEPSSGASGVITGWAANDILVDINVSVLSAEVCGSGDYKYSEDEILDSMLCGLATNSQACGGLNGNPVVVNNQLVGLVSWGYGCGNKGNPSVLTNIPELRSWIVQEAESL